MLLLVALPHFIKELHKVSVRIGLFLVRNIHESCTQIQMHIDALIIDAY